MAEPAPQAPAPRGDAPVGLGRGSLLLPTAFERAITRLRGGGYKGLMNLRVAPERIDATLITRGGSLRRQITPDGGCARSAPARAASAGCRRCR